MRLEVVGLAAHNAVFSVWNACAYFPLPLQTTALAFVPACASFMVRTARCDLCEMPRWVAKNHVLEELPTFACSPLVVWM